MRNLSKVNMLDVQEMNAIEMETLNGGCFWCWVGDNIVPVAAITGGVAAAIAGAPILLVGAGGAILLGGGN